MLRDDISDFFGGVSNYLNEANKYAQFGNMIFGDGSVPAGYYPAQNPAQYPVQYNAGLNTAGFSTGNNTMNMLLIGAVVVTAIILITKKK